MRKTTSYKFISMIWINIITSCQCDYEGVTWTSRRVKSPSSSLFVQHRKHQSTALMALWEGNPPVKCCGRKPPRYFSSRMRRGPINTEVSRLHITPQSAVRMLGRSRYFSSRIRRGCPSAATWWRHQMETLSALLAPFVRGIHRSPVNSPHKVQWRGALMFSLICAWTNDWVTTNRDAGDLRRRRAYYIVSVINHIISPTSRVNDCGTVNSAVLSSSWPVCLPLRAHYWTHWGRDYMTAIFPFSRRYFQTHFLEWKCWNFDFDFTEVCCWWSN